MPVNLADDVAVRAEPGPAQEEWLDRITDHILRTGMDDSSMRRLAEVAGTSHRMLGYYFSSRDGVLGTVLQRLRQRESSELIAAAANRREALEAAWRYFTAPERRLEMEIFFHLAGEAVRAPGAYTRFLEAVVSTWADAIGRLGVVEGLDDEQARIEGRLLTSAARGLLLDRMMTGAEGAVDAAYGRLLDAVLGPPR